MIKLDDVKLAKKLGGGFLAVALIVLAVGLTGIWGISRLGSRTAEIGEVRLPGVADLQQMHAETERITGAMNALLSPYLDRERRRALYARIEESRQAYKAALEGYQALPKSPQEEMLLEEFRASAAASATANDAVRELSRRLDALDVQDPGGLTADLQLFRADHHKLESDVARLLLSGERFSGGADATACNFGRWLATFRTENPRIRKALEEVRADHDEFHRVAGEIRKAVEEGRGQEALELYAGRMIPAARSVFGHLDEIRAEAQEARGVFERMTVLSQGEALTATRRTVAWPRPRCARPRPRSRAAGPWPWGAWPWALGWPWPWAWC